MFLRLDPEVTTIIVMRGSKTVSGKIGTRWVSKDDSFLGRVLGARLRFPAFKIHCWNGKQWTVRFHRAYRYRTKDTAEKTAFGLTIKEPSLIGELVVEERNA